jgi:hypothetical protein
MADARLSLTYAIRQAMRAHAPGWTDSNDSDPGLTILEVIAYLAESQVFHTASPTAVSSAAVRAIVALERLADREPVAVLVNGEPWRVVDSLADAGPDDAVFTLDGSTGEVTFGDGVHGRVPASGSIIVRYREGSQGAAGNTTVSVRTTWPPRHRHFGVSLRQRATPTLTNASVYEHWGGSLRPNYFSGRLLGAQDFREEQQYHVDKHRRHLQALHGAGVVRGLDASISPDGSSVTVNPGLAIDSSGREIILGEPVVITPPAGLPSPSWLVVEYAERGVDPVPTVDGEPQPSRIQEGCQIILTPSPGDTSVTLARLVNDANVWRFDLTR